MLNPREPFGARFLHYGCAEHPYLRTGRRRAVIAMTYFSRESAEDTTPKLIGFIGFDGVSSFDLLGACEAFAAARVGEAHPCYEPVIIGAGAETFVSSAGTVIKARYTIQTAPPLDTIIIPGGAGLRHSEASSKITAWLIDRAKSTRRIAAIAAGIYPLASTGLLSGRAVTTHWRLANDVARAFPALAVSNGVSFVKSDRFYTCGGGVAGIEMSLALIEEDYGAKTALAVARELSIDLRPAGAAPQIPLPQHQAGPAERLAELPTWIASRLHRDLTVEVLAERAGLSPRHFYRLFKDTFKSTPAAFIQQLRINEARQRLAGHRENVETVASSVGFKSPAVFRRAFGRQVGYPPSRVLRGAEAKPQHS
jgi:transcriptional regulator GlxA family with amidase domain